MNRAQALRRVAGGIAADLADYGRLKTLLAEQFDAVVRHDSARVAGIGEAIAALAGVLDRRRVERVTLAGQLAGADGASAMRGVFALLPAAVRGRVEGAWAALETRVRECKALNLRNCELLMSQYEIMQRVLDDEADTYAPR